MNPSSNILLRILVGAFLLVAVTVSNASAQTAAATLTTLHTFSQVNSVGFGENTDGADPCGLVLGMDGNYYGTTTTGGSNSYGAVFMMTPNGGFATLHSFSSSDGEFPNASLVQGSDGNFYGSTIHGASKNAGTIFKITASGSLHVLHSFSGGKDGASPVAALLEDGNGTFYGTAAAGGIGATSSGAGYSGNGIVFKITSSGSFTTLYSFTGGADGGNPFCNMVVGSNGNLYGCTSAGGANGEGTVFTITPTGSLTTLYSFGALNDQEVNSDGVDANSLVLSSDGNFYGTTRTGGAYGDGTVFKMTTSGSLTTLYTFTRNGDGFGPNSSLTAGNDGNFYGTTRGGGGGLITPGFFGTIFRITPFGTLTTLYDFSDGDDGENPTGGLTRGIDGSFYGVTFGESDQGGGTVFMLSLPVLTNTITTVMSSVNPVTVGASVTFTAEVSPAVPNDETVTFYDGDTSIGTGSTSSGVASIALSSLSVGTHTITAIYPGDATFEASTSISLLQAVTAPIVPHTFLAGIQMISVPTDYAGESPASVLGYPSPVFAVWQPTADTYAVTPTPPADSLVAGQGYWVRVPVGGASITAAGTAPPTPFSIAVAAGWNMIGCAESTAVAVSSLSVIDSSGVPHTFASAALSGIVQDPMYTFQAGDTNYEVVTGASGTLQPYYGYWLYVSQACTLGFPTTGG